MRDTTTPVPRPANEHPLRDQFAMQAMKILLTPQMTMNPIHFKRLGVYCYATADLMMEARKKINTMEGI